MSPEQFIPLGANDPGCTAQPACIPPINTGSGPVVQIIPPQANTTRASWQPAAAQAVPATTVAEQASPLIAERNTLGLILAAVLILVTLSLWFAYGAWPRRQWRAFRDTLHARKEGRQGQDAEKDVREPECRPFHVYSVERDAENKGWRGAGDMRLPAGATLSEPAGVYGGGGAAFGRGRTDGADEALMGPYVKVELA